MAAMSCPFGMAGMRPPRSRRCGRCRQEYGDEAWQRLEVMRHILAPQVRDLVTAWPDDVAIEIRRCGACGAPIARKERPFTVRGPAS
jgi:hypothetical protein